MWDWQGKLLNVGFMHDMCTDEECNFTSPNKQEIFSSYMRMFFSCLSVYLSSLSNFGSFSISVSMFICVSGLCVWSVFDHLSVYLGWPHKPKPQCHSRCGTIKSPPFSKDIFSASHYLKNCSPSPPMVMSPCECNFWGLDVKQCMINRSIWQSALSFGLS